MRFPAIAVAAVVLTAPLATGARASTCPLMTDVQGDTVLALGTVHPPSPLAPARADIVSGDVASGATTVVAVLRVASFAPDPFSSLEEEWQVAWKVGSDQYGARLVRVVGPDETFHVSFSVNGAVVSGVSYAVDAANATVTWTVPRSSLPGLATPGQTFDQIHAQTLVLGGTADIERTTQTYVDQDPGCVAAA